MSEIFVYMIQNKRTLIITGGFSTYEKALRYIDSDTENFAIRKLNILK